MRSILTWQRAWHYGHATRAIGLTAGELAITP